MNNNNILRDEVILVANGVTESGHQAFIDKLRQQNSKELIRKLRELSADPDPVVRWKVADILLDLDFSGNLNEVLDVMINDPSEIVRGGICYRLRELPDLRSIQPLISVLQNDVSGTNRFWAADALGAIGSLKAIPALEYARDFDAGTDDEGRPISLPARRAIAEILSRNNH
jgi:HEAT repeat protein